MTYDIMIILQITIISTLIVALSLYLISLSHNDDIHFLSIHITHLSKIHNKIEKLSVYATFLFLFQCGIYLLIFVLKL